MTDENVDEELAQIEEEIKKLESNPGGSSSPFSTEKSKDTLINLAREMLLTEDTRKFANLDQKYIGIPTLPINTYLEIEEYCKIEGMDELAEIFRRDAENMLATSLSIQGFFARLLVTQIKKEEKAPESIEKKQKSWGLFKNKYGVDG